MTTRESPLREIFFPHETGIPDQVISRVVSRPGLVVVLPNFGADILGAVQKDIKDSVDKILQMTPLDILNEGWTKYREVLKALSDSRQKPNDPILKPLVTHTVKSSHHPYVELCLDEKPVWKIEFEATASLMVESVTLKIQNGIITHVLSGTCQGKFKLMCLGQLLAEAKSVKFTLPGAVALEADHVKPHETPAQIARLTGLCGEVADHVFNLTDGFVIGRSSKSSIRLSEATVSRHHARLRCVSNHWFIQDLESVIGIYVNGVRVDATALKDGDRVRIGEAEFEFHE